MDVDNPTGRNVEDISFDEEKVYHFVLFYSPLAYV